MKTEENISRREFLRAAGAAGAVVAGVSACGNDRTGGTDSPTNSAYNRAQMTFRTTPTTGDKVSLLGYGCMRWPMKPKAGGAADEQEPDQEAINALVDKAIEGGVNYFDTSPVYVQGLSEKVTGIALSRHPRNKYFIATKMSNFWGESQTREGSIAMYRKSMEDLQTDYIDYYLLHAIGQGGMASLKARFLDNGILDFLLKEREAGRIRNLGFSYHGDVAVYDYLLQNNDKYHWDFAQIQMNYIDWKHAKRINPRNTNAEYLYGELSKRNIPAVIMEPLLGGRLANVPRNIFEKMKERRPEDSIASWAFRFAGTWPGVLTSLSGMTYMEHLTDNLRTHSPLEPCTEEELEFLEEAAKMILDYPTIPCTTCQYCMPCPYGLDIPSIFAHYNKCVEEGNIPTSAQDEAYRKARRAFLVGYDRTVPKLRQADHCIGCDQCSPHCPQGIEIPLQMHRIARFVEKLKQGTL